MRKTLSQIEDMYAERDRRIAELGTLQRVDIRDLKGFERTGRFIIADKLWNRLTEDAKNALLHDEHAHVRSCARISAMKAS